MSLTWTASADRETLIAAKYELIEFAALRREIIDSACKRRTRRTSIDNPAQDWLDRVAQSPRLAILGVTVRDLDDLAALHGYVLEPALRAGAELAIECQQRLTRLPADRFIDPDFAYPYTLERAVDAATRLYRGEPPQNDDARAPDLNRTHFEADPEQLRAVNAHDGICRSSHRPGAARPRS
jgi:hypothetical protein